MARPVMEKSVDGQTGTGGGEHLETGGRITISLFAIAPNLDTANDDLDVVLDGSMDGENWVEMSDLSLTTSDFEDVSGDGTSAALSTFQGAAVRYIRARVSSYTDADGDDLSVTAWVGASHNSDSARDYREIG